MIAIRTNTLDLVNRGLGISGRGAPETTFADEELLQTVDVGPLIRLSRTPAESGGIFYAIIRHVHGAAGDLETGVAPYDLETPGAIGAYADPMTRGFDVWLISACVRRVSGAGTLTVAQLGVSYFSGTQGWGVDDSGVAVVVADIQALATWETLISTPPRAYGLLSGGNGTMVYPKLRLQRNPSTRIQFISTVAAAAATLDLQLVLGVFPEGLGQDVVA